MIFWGPERCPCGPDTANIGLLCIQTSVLFSINGLHMARHLPVMDHNEACDLQEAFWISPGPSWVHFRPKSTQKYLNITSSGLARFPGDPPPRPPTLPWSGPFIKAQSLRRTSNSDVDFLRCQPCQSGDRSCARGEFLREPLKQIKEEI